MLQNLHVKNLALIDECEVEFSDGLNRATGQPGTTGAAFQGRAVAVLQRDRTNGG